MNMRHECAPRILEAVQNNQNRWLNNQNRWLARLAETLRLFNPTCAGNDYIVTEAISV